MTFTPDPAELIAAEVLAYLDDAGRDFDADVVGNATFSVPANPSEELFREGLFPRVLIIPVGDSETKFTRGTAVEATHSINVIAIAPLDETITRAKFNGFVYAMKKSLRAVTMGGYVWQATDTLTKFDPDQIRTRAQMLSAFQLQYFGVE